MAREFGQNEYLRTLQQEKEATKQQETQFLDLLKSITHEQIDAKFINAESVKAIRDNIQLCHMMKSNKKIILLKCRSKDLIQVLPATITIDGLVTVVLFKYF